MSDMPRVIWAANNGHSYGKWLTDGCTAYTRTDLVDEKDKRITALEDAIKEITIIVDDCCEINAQHYSHDQAIEQNYALSTIRHELSRLLKLKDKGSDG